MIQSDLQTDEDDDLSANAGWMYSDLLIGLMVVFLATITFLPSSNLSNNANSNTSQKNYFYTYAKVLQDKPLSILIVDNELPDFPQLLKEFKAKNSITNDATIAYVQIVGAYRENLETRQAAVSRALALSQKIENSYHDLFSAASTTFNTTTTIPSNQSVIRILFAETVSVGKG